MIQSIVCLSAALLTVGPATPAACPAARQEPVDLAAIGLLRDEGLNHSQAMDTLWHLTDLHGPRLTNSPAERRASRWAVERFLEFGLENVALEPWGEFGLGWSFERCVVELRTPAYMPLIAIPKAWTLGLEEALEGAPILIDAEDAEGIEAFRGQLAGRIVLFGEVAEIDSHFEALAKRHDEESLEELVQEPEPSASDGNRWARYRARRELRRKLVELMKEEGAGVLIEPDGGRRNDYGVILLGSGGSYDPEEERGMPQVVVAGEHFNRIARLLEREEPVTMRVKIETTFYDDDLTGYNVVAELPGKDPSIGDEVVMLGAHFDSWHPATGATDNGAACSVVMEAMRLLRTTGLEPRRTIRAVLWTGEEQGLLGSRGYVKKHFGDRDSMVLTPEHERLSAYFNLDNGAGRIRGIYLQQNLACGPIFEAWLRPFHDLGARTLALRNTGSTDHIPFDALGLPGFQFVQDPMDYGSRTHHSNMDFYERVHEEDLERSAVILASFAYHAAQRDAKLPRKRLPEPKPEPEPEPAEE